MKYLGIVQGKRLVAKPIEFGDPLPLLEITRQSPQWFLLCKSALIARGVAYEGPPVAQVIWTNDAISLKFEPLDLKTRVQFTRFAILSPEGRWINGSDIPTMVKEKDTLILSYTLCVA